MIRRIWAALAALWAVIAIFVVLAVSQRPKPPLFAGTNAALTRTAGGSVAGVATTSGLVHATTSSSIVAGQPSAAMSVGAPTFQLYVRTATGTFVPVASAPASNVVTTTRSS